MNDKMKFNALMSALTATLHDYQILFSSTDEMYHHDMVDDAVSEIYDILALHFPDHLWQPEQSEDIYADGVFLACDGEMSGDAELDIQMAIVLKEMFTLWQRKHHDYGSGNIGILGERGIFVRMFDKMQRLLQLVWKEKSASVSNESVNDTYLDMAVYSVIAILVRRGLWPGVSSEKTA